MSENIILALIPAISAFLTVWIQTGRKKDVEDINSKISNIKSVVDEITEIGKKNNVDIGNLKGDVGQLNKDITNLKQDVKKLKSDVGYIGDGILETERYRLEEDLTAIIKRGYRTSDDTRRITALFKSYQSLGGNGYIEDLFNQFMKLELREM
jgi:hypothetical protein|uniref:Peptidoglycan n=1 Tax=Siphoviridae sp. ctFNZ2 TaxID=2823572 RepID=A0A8S5LAA8_9CAUD|nr:MAG TPA: peptidoglycan [Siphoviridae sp. ctFNZ2]DAR44858.1 MAG TPA: SECRETED 45 KDA PROTEIN CYCLE, PEPTIDOGLYCAN, CHAP, CELL [Caudoviricetes sp.]